MSSIAYVTDEEMLEYDRLCAKRTILFWRLASRKIQYFYKGDLLFFFARPQIGRKKAFIGYAHYDSVKKLSIQQIWKQYGDACGYASRKRFEEAVMRASRDDMPRQLQCLLLTDVVFFSTPVYPEEVNIEIPKNLESYIYLDREDPTVTLHILQTSEKHGIDLWSQDRTKNPADIFANDETRHIFAVIYNTIGEQGGTKHEKTIMRRLTSEKLKQNRWEIIRGSRFDCIHMTEKQLHIAVPFVCQQNDYQLRIREYIGRIVLYKQYAEKYNIERRIYFQILGDEIPADLSRIVDKINHE